MKKRMFYIFTIVLFSYVGLLSQSTSKIYYTRYDTYHPYVYSSDLDGSNETHFSLPNKPKSIAVDWNNTPVKLFIALDLGSGNGKIIRCNTDGTNQEDVVPTTTGQVNDIELNVGAKEIYWIEDSYSDDYIYHGVMYGTNNSPSEIYHSTADNVTLWGLGLNVGDNTLWFTLRGGSHYASYVKQMLTNGTALHTVKNPVNNPHDIEFYNGNYYLCTGEGIAKIEGGTKVYSVIQASETSGDGISIDSYYHKIYWVDYLAGRVKKCNFDGSGVTTVSTTLYGMLQKIDTDYNVAALPVELTSFSAKVIGETVVLNWQTATEVNNYGFEIERQNQVSSIKNQDKSQSWETIGFVEGHGNSSSPKEYLFVDTSTPLSASAVALHSLSYRLKQIDTDGTFEYSDVVVIKMDSPKKFKLIQNYPNPFNPSTVIRYDLPQGGAGIRETKFVTLKVFNSLGQEVATLVNQKQNAGSYEVKFNASSLPSGIYFYSITAGENVSVKKMMLLK